MSALRDRIARFRQPAVFGLSAAVSRAGAILSVPIAAQALSLEDLGYYAICAACIQLLCQLLSLGGSVAVAKAGAENVDFARAIAIRFALVAVVAGVLILIAGVFSGHRFGFLAGLVAMISALEAHQQLYQLVIRAQEREGVFFATSVVKAFAWPLAILAYIFAIHQGRADIDIETILMFQLAVYAAISAGYLLVVGLGLGTRLSSENTFRAAVILSLPMVLHAFSQWMISSADRVVLGQLADGDTLAFYSLAYSLASIMFVIVSAMALYLPHEIMKRIERWGDPDFRYRFVKWYALAYTVMFVCLVSAYAFDYTVTNLLRYRNPDMFVVLGVVGAAFVFTGVYHTYVPFLFAAGRTKLITLQTVQACVLYAIAIVPLVYFQGGIGAAVGTLLVWIFYMLSIRRHAVRYLRELGLSDSRRLYEMTAVIAAASTCLITAVVYRLLLA